MPSHFTFRCSSADQDRPFKEPACAVRVKESSQRSRLKELGVVHRVDGFPGLHPQVRAEDAEKGQPGSGRVLAATGPKRRFRKGDHGTPPFSGLGLVLGRGPDGRLRATGRPTADAGQGFGSLRHVGATAWRTLLHYALRFANHSPNPSPDSFLGNRPPCG